ncbi:hypothetical protein SCOR_32195 [Sulfidibacter corallicola]|uniref:Uncharacterized protein n=1 Tax=Sulfidibacter corallicola TaxID=2818388 RepID=A0A8A4TIP6_SULCO|nr:hypothetical protein [Sulfidibacter corallicola]QTD49796.1 hypothetical protein J3U87_29790 [Sulfidibacter corallicola]
MLSGIRNEKKCPVYLAFLAKLLGLLLVCLSATPPILLFEVLEPPSSGWACESHDCGCDEAKCKVNCCCFPQASEPASDDAEGAPDMALSDMCRGPQERTALLVGFDISVPNLVKPRLRPENAGGPDYLRHPAHRWASPALDPPDKVPIDHA